MQLTVTTEDGSSIHVLDVALDLEIDNVKALIEIEMGIPVATQQLIHNGREWTVGHKCLKDYEVTENDLVLVRQVTPSSAPVPSPNRAPPAATNNSGEDHVELFRQQLLNNPRQLQQLSSQQPEWAQAVHNRELFGSLVNQFQEQQRAAMAQRQQEMALRNSDPFNADAQKSIEEAIRMENVRANMEHAYEHYPESFGSIIMLYIDCEVNGYKIKAFVDSGAQATIISPELAEKCGLMRLLDKRFAAIAQGVGTAPILGRVHSAPIKIGSQFYACSFSVMEGKGIDLLLGLDMLRRHQACIDLEHNVLRMGGANSISVPFLGEADLPEKARQNLEAAKSPK